MLITLLSNTIDPQIRSGSMYPSVKFEFEGSGTPSSKSVKALNKLIAAVDPLRTYIDVPEHDALEAAMHATWQLCEATGLPIHERGQLIDHRAVVPFWWGSHRLVIRAFGLVIDYLNDEKVKKGAFDKLVADMRAESKRLHTTGYYITAAFKLGVSFRELSDRFVRFEHEGKTGFIMNGLNSKNNVVASNVVASKVLCAQIMRNSSFPISTGTALLNINHAKKVASEIGYPVVIKDAMGSNGVGVIAGIANEDDLVTALGLIGKSATQMLLEKHIDGTDYRFNVINGKVATVITRSNAQVVGDGTSTIKQLIDAENKNPLRTTGKYAMILIEPDPTMEFELARQGATLDTVPEKGKTVLLRSVCNLSSGGTATRYLGEIHKDNRKLIEDVARLFDIGYVGIDMISPDITVSWKDNGAIVCDVNGNHCLGKMLTFDAYEQTLRSTLGLL